MKYEVEYASFRTVIFEADSQEEAIDKVAVIEDYEIESKSHSGGYTVWNGPKQID